MNDVKQEETLMKESLLEAAQQELEELLADPQPVTPSPAFQREMRAMLRDPERWADGKERVRRSRWKKLSRVAAAVALAFLVGAGSLLAVSPELRASVGQVVLERYPEHTVYRYEGVSDTGPLPMFVITALPEGYTDTDETLEGTGTRVLFYQNEQGKKLLFSVDRIQSGSLSMVITKGTTVSDCKVHGMPGQLYLSDDPTKDNGIIWHDERAKLAFTIAGYVSEQELLHMAESVSLVKSPKS